MCARIWLKECKVFMPDSDVITKRTCPRYNEFLFSFLPFFSFCRLPCLSFEARKVFCKISILVRVCPSSCELINQNVCTNKSPKNAPKKNLVAIRPKCQIVSQPEWVSEWPPYALSLSISPQSIKSVEILNQLHARIHFERLSKHKRTLPESLPQSACETLLSQKGLARKVG